MSFWVMRRLFQNILHNSQDNNFCALAAIKCKFSECCQVTRNALNNVHREGSFQSTSTYDLSRIKSNFIVHNNFIEFQNDIVIHTEKWQKILTETSKFISLSIVTKIIDNHKTDKTPKECANLVSTVPNTNNTIIELKRLLLIKAT